MSLIKKKAVSLFIVLIFISITYILVCYSPYKIFLLDYLSYVIGIVSGIFILFFNLIITRILKWISNNKNNRNPFYTHQSKIDSMNFIFLSFLIFFGALFEEIVFRSYVFFYLCQVTNIYISIFISSILFTLIHYKGRHIEIFLMSLVYSIILIYTKNLLAPIIAHFVNNYIIFLKKKYEKCTPLGRDRGLFCN